MSCFQDPFLPVIQHDIRDQLFHCQEEANKSRALELKSSLTLQRWWRVILRKRQLQREVASAILIQRVWRGHAGRTRYGLLRKYKRQILQEEYYHFMARKIQCVWRSYKSRCNPDNKCNMARRRQQQYTSTLNGQIWKETVAKQNEETLERARVLDQQYRAHLQSQLRQRIHALMSTSAQRGVLTQHDSRVEIVLDRILSKEITVDQFMRMDLGDATKLTVLVQLASILDNTGDDVEAYVLPSRKELATIVVKRHRDARKQQFLDTFGHAAVNLRQSFTQSTLPSQLTSPEFYKTTEMVSMQPVHSPPMRVQEPTKWTNPYVYHAQVLQPPTNLPKRSPQDLNRVLAAMCQCEQQQTGDLQDMQRACRMHVERVMEHTMYLLERRQPLVFLPLENEYFEGPSAPVEPEPEEVKDPEAIVHVGKAYGETVIERKQQDKCVQPYQCTGNADQFHASLRVNALYNQAPTVKDQETILALPKCTQASTGGLSGISLRARAIDACFTGSAFDSVSQELAGYRKVMSGIVQPNAPVSLLRRYQCLDTSMPVCVPEDTVEKCVALPNRTVLGQWSDVDLVRICRRSKRKYTYYNTMKKVNRGYTVDIKRIQGKSMPLNTDVDDSIIKIIGNEQNIPIGQQYEDTEAYDSVSMSTLSPYVPHLEVLRSSTNEILRLQINEHEVPSVVHQGVPVHVYGLSGPLRSVLKVGLSALKKRLEFGKDNGNNFVHGEGALTAGSVLQCKVLVPVIPTSTNASRNVSRNSTPSNASREAPPATLPSLNNRFKKGDCVQGVSITKPAKILANSNGPSTSFQGANISFEILIEQYYPGLPAVGMLQNLHILTSVQSTEPQGEQVSLNNLSWMHDREHVELVATRGDFVQDCIGVHGHKDALDPVPPQSYVITMQDLLEEEADKEEESYLLIEQNGSLTPTSSSTTF